MKRKITAMLLTLAMVLTLLPMTALAAYPGVPDPLEAPILLKHELRLPTIDPMSYSEGEKVLYVELQIPASIIKLNSERPGENTSDVTLYIDNRLPGATYSEWHNIGGGFWVDEILAQPVSGKANTYFVEQQAAELIGPDGKTTDYEIRAYFTYYCEDASGSPAGSKSGYSNILSTKVDLKGSTWAQPELKKAADMNLIPDSLKNADLTKPITRAEFAAVAVKVYENLSGTKAVAASKNPFKDTADPEVLKAYNVGITSGTAADKFTPNDLLNREQCATMLTRVLKRCYIPGWTLGTDNYTLKFTMPAKFADDAKISDWAIPSVYFMAANGIIAGVGNNNFAPRATTSAEQAANYASATREQAIIIGARMVENLGGKKLEYTEGKA